MTVRLTGPAAGLPRPDRDLLRSRARAVLRLLGHARSELSIALVNDTDIADLNRRYRGRSRPTDVLAFSQLEGEHVQRRGVLLGDVVIGVEVATRQARSRHRALDDEVARLMIHGTLHLLGHDHVRDDEARTMRVEERRLWREIRS